MVEGAQLLGGGPGDGDGVGRVADLQSEGDLAALGVGEGLDAAVQQPADLIQRVALAASVAKRGLLDPLAGLVDYLVG